MTQSRRVYPRAANIMNFRAGSEQPLVTNLSSVMTFEKLQSLRSGKRLILWVRNRGNRRSTSIYIQTPEAPTFIRRLQRWKDADPDIPILKEAKAEYAKLQ
jgi:hypothetical protein